MFGSSQTREATTKAPVTAEDENTVEGENTIEGENMVDTDTLRRVYYRQHEDKWIEKPEKNCDRARYRRKTPGSNTASEAACAISSVAGALRDSASSSPRSIVAPSHHYYQCSFILSKAFRVDRCTLVVFRGATREKFGDFSLIVRMHVEANVDRVEG